MVLVVLVLVAGGAVAVSTGVVDLRGESTAAETPTPTETPDVTPTPTPAPTLTPTPTSTPTPTPTPTPADEGEEYDVEFPGAATITVYGRTLTPIESGTLTIYDEDESAVAEFDLTKRHINTVDELTPEKNYTAEVTEAGAGNIWPDTRKTFDPGKVDDLEIEASFWFNDAETYRYQVREIAPPDINEDGEPVEPTPRVYALGKRGDDGNAYLELSNFYREELPPHPSLTGPGKFLKVNWDSYYLKGSGTDGWIEFDHMWYDPEGSPLHILVKEGLSEFDGQFDRTFLGTWEINDEAIHPKLTEPRNESLSDTLNHTTPPEAINGTEAHVYRLNVELGHRWQDDYEYEDLLVWVDPDTGYVLRVYSEMKLLNGELQESRLVIDFYDHGDVEINPHDYQPWDD